MNVSEIRIRWIYAACYEIILPNGKVIVVDPYVTPEKLDGFSVDDFTGADYILVSHTHYDHTADILPLVEKFDAKVFVGEMSASYLATCFNLCCSNIYPISNGDTFEMEDFTLEVFRGKHNLLPKKEFTPDKILKRTETLQGFPGHGQCDLMGSIEYYDMLITTQDNFRILIVGGGPPIFDTILGIAKERRPNILIRQASGFNNPAEFAKNIDRFKAPIVFPHHHENIPKKFAIPVDEFLNKTTESLQEIGSTVKVVNPAPFKWYRIMFSVLEEQ